MALSIAQLIREGFDIDKKDSKKEFSPAKLPYSYDSLSEFIDGETMKVHYNGHYKGYVKKLNELLSEKDSKIDYSKGVELLMGRVNGLGKKIKNQAGGAYNHELFWQMMTPEKEKRKFEGKIKELIDNQYGGLDKFKEEFLKEAKAKFGSGWCWVVQKPSGRLKIMTTSNQDNPKMNIFLSKDKHGDDAVSYNPIAGKIVLGLDLWEHAYYLKYRNKKDDYVNNFWKVVNWDFVNERLK